MAVVVVSALRHALDSARIDSGLKADEDLFYHLGAPTTSSEIFLSAKNKPEHFILK